MSWWVATEQERDEILSKWNIALWPAPNTARVHRFMRMHKMLPDFNPAAGRIFVELLPATLPPQVLRAIVTIDNFAENDCWGETEADEDGRKIKLSIRADDDFVDDQANHWSGMVYAVEYSRTGFDWKRISFIDALGPHTSQQARFPPFVQHDAFNRFAGEKNEQGGPNPDWGFTPFPQVAMSSVSECSSPAGAPAPAVAGRAEFNGVDAYIALDHNLKRVNQDFIISARIRLHNTTGFWPIMGVEGTGGFMGMDGPDLIFGNFRQPTTWTPVLDQWFTWRLEFEQLTQLGYKLFIDDIEVHSFTGSRQQMAFNTLGVFRHNDPGVIWGDFDMQNLKYLSGNAPSTNVELDMPLDVNALDVGPDANHGTTFNMALPSV